jgi:hypothetical protein
MKSYMVSRQCLQVPYFTCKGEPLLNELSKNEQFVFTNIARPFKLRLPIHLTNIKPRAYEHFNNLTLTNLTIYLTGGEGNKLTNTFQRTQYVRKLGLAYIWRTFFL